MLRLMICLVFLVGGGCASSIERFDYVAPEYTIVCTERIERDAGKLVTYVLDTAQQAKR